MTAIRFLILSSIILILSACTTVPEQIQGEYASITPARSGQNLVGQDVRWGGIILQTNVESDHTCFEILSRELDKYLRPELEDQSTGRYMACNEGFYDPAVFARGREVTLTGTISEMLVRPLDEYEYHYPVVDIDNLVLWETRTTVLVTDHFNDPFYGPWHGRWPYRGWYDPWYGGHHGRSVTRPRTLLPDASIVESENTRQQ